MKEGRREDSEQCLRMPVEPTGAFYNMEDNLILRILRPLRSGCGDFRPSSCSRADA